MRRLRTIPALALAACTATAALPEVVQEAAREDVASPTEVRAGTADLGGDPVHYLESGRGHAGLVFVHGWAGDASVWRSQLPALADLGRLIAVDLPGHGKSAAPAGELTLDRCADAVAAALDDAGVKRAVVVGHSNGTSTALRFQRRHPERTLGLVIVDGALEPFLAGDDLERTATAFRGDGWEELLSGTMKGMLGTLAPELAADLEGRALATPQRILVESLLVANAPEAFPTEPVETPALVLHAPAPFWSEAYLERVRALFPEGEVHVLQDVGHFLMLDDPETFAGLVTDFVEGRRLL